MATANADADEAVLTILDRYGVLMLDDLITGRPDFSLTQLFLAIDRLRRTNVIALRRIGLRDEIRLTNPAWPLGLAPQHQEPVAPKRYKPDVFDRVFGVEGTWSTSPNGPGQQVRGTAMRLGIIVSAVMVSVSHGSLMVPLRIWSGLLRQCHTPDC